MHVHVQIVSPRALFCMYVCVCVSVCVRVWMHTLEYILSLLLKDLLGSTALNRLQPLVESREIVLTLL